MLCIVEEVYGNCIEPTPLRPRLKVIKTQDGGLVASKLEPKLIQIYCSWCTRDGNEMSTATHITALVVQISNGACRNNVAPNRSYIQYGDLKSVITFISTSRRNGI